MRQNAKKQQTRSVNDYMSRQDGRAVGATQVVGARAHKRLSQQLQEARNIMAVFKKSGLDIEARKMNERIKILEHARRELEDQLNEERREIVRAMLLCHASCDVTTIAADQFADVLHKNSRNVYGEDNSFSAEVRGQADAFNKLVCSIDEAGHKRMSMMYADMAQDITDKVVPIMKEIIAKYCDSEKGKKWF